MRASAVAMLVVAGRTAYAEPMVATLHGLVELDAGWDSTQGFADFAGNASIARPGTSAGDHGQTTFGARNSRFGLTLALPTRGELALRGELEMDFLGSQPPGVSESARFQSPTLRLRHAYVSFGTSRSDVLVGQSWQLFDWQPKFFPNTVEIQGVPGEVFGRAPQIRASTTMRAGDLDVQLAIAVARPAERSSSTPDVEAGIDIELTTLRSLHTIGAATTSLAPASLGVSVIGRRFALDTASGEQPRFVAYGRGISLDASIPIITGTREHPEHSLSLTASLVRGSGIADLYTGLTAGIEAPMRATQIDPGLVASTADGALHPVQWTSAVVGAQYYLPPHGNVWLSANLARLRSDNARWFGDPSTTYDRVSWIDGNLFVDVASGLRLGLELARFTQTYVDGVAATNVRAQFGAWLIF